MILISTIINKYKHAFLEQYKKSILPSHHKALWAMEHCRQGHGPYMLAQCTDHDCGKKNISRTPAVTGIALIARTMKISSGLKINWTSVSRPNTI